MEIGTLNQRITFLVNRVVTDEIGNHTAMWDEVFSCWAKALELLSCNLVKKKISRNFGKI